jgi:hypothetical protein
MSPGDKNATVTARLSRLCGGDGPGQLEGVDFCLGRLGGVNGPIFRCGEDPAQFRDHVGG